MPSTGTHDYQPAREITITTTGNIDNLDIDGASLLRMNNASLATIRGIKAGYAGQIISIVSIGAGQVDLAHQNANSSTANRFINVVTGVSTPLFAGKGNAIYQYDNTTQRWRLIHYEQGAPISISYNSGNFTASGSMTWTVDSSDQTTFQYVLVGKILTVSFVLKTTSVGGTVSTQLRIAVPNGFSAILTVSSIIWIDDNGSKQAGFAEVGGTIIFIKRLDEANWTLSTNATEIYGSISFEVS